MFGFLTYPWLIVNIAGLPPDARSDDVSKFFEGYGRIIDCRVMTGSSDKKDPNNPRLNKPSSGFGFIEFESSKAIRDSIHIFYMSLIVVGRMLRTL